MHSKNVNQKLGGCPNDVVIPSFDEVKIVRGWILCDPSVPEQIERKAAQLSRRCGYNRSDLEDLKQDMRAYLIEMENRHDPDRGSVGAYVHCLLKYWFRKRMRYWKQQLRKGHLSNQSYDDGQMHTKRSESETRNADFETKDLLEVCIIRLSDEEIEMLKNVCRIGKSKTAVLMSISRRQVDNRMGSIKSSCADFRDLDKKADSR